MATIQVSVCDVCSDPTRDIVTYTIMREGESAMLDLCQEHGEAIEEIAAGSWSWAGTSPRSAARQRRAPRAVEPVKVVSMAEIERLKIDKAHT